MALSVSTAPVIVSLSDDPIWLDLLTDNYKTSSGGTEYHSLHFSDSGAIANDTLKIEWGSESLLFTCKADPDDSGTQFIPKGAFTKEYFVEKLYDCLKSNYTLSLYFNITLGGSGDTIDLIAKNKGSEFILTITFDGSAPWENESGDTSIAVGSDETYRENFKINAALYDENGLIEGSEMEGTPGSDNHALFNLSKKGLKPLLSTDYTYPENTSNLLIKRTDPVKKYYFRYWESYGIPSVSQEVNTSSWYYVMKGKSSYMQQAYYHEQGDSWWLRLLSSHKFLTLQPNNKKVSITQVEKLFYLHHHNFVDTLKLRVKIYYTDDTTTEVLKDTLTPVEKYDVIECCVGFSIMELGDVTPAKTVEKYEVWLTDATTGVLTEKRMYYLDQTFYKQKRFFIFENSLGSFDSMRATGIGSSKANYNKKVVSMELPVNYTSKDREVLQINQEEIRKFTVNFGILNNLSGDVYALDWKNYARQLELTGKAYEVINGRTVPVQFATDEVLLHTDKSKIYDIILSYERAFIDAAYSDDEIPITGDYNDDYYNDYFTGL